MVILFFLTEKISKTHNLGKKLVLKTGVKKILNFLHAEVGKINQSSVIKVP